jgi:hypothetical protein
MTTTLVITLIKVSMSALAESTAPSAPATPLRGLGMGGTGTGMVIKWGRGMGATRVT